MWCYVTPKALQNISAQRLQNGGGLFGLFSAFELIVTTNAAPFRPTQEGGISYFFTNDFVTAPSSVVTRTK